MSELKVRLAVALLGMYVSSVPSAGLALVVLKEGVGPAAASDKIVVFL